MEEIQNTAPAAPGVGVSSGRPTIVILGSGYAGAKCARTIQNILGKEADLFVVDKRSCNIHKMAAPRAAVVGEKYTDRILIPNNNLVLAGKGQMMNEPVQEVDAKQVVLKNGHVIPFDYLVCATGSVSFSVAEPPLKYSSKKSMQNFYNKVAKKIESARKIIIVGGGPVGVEMAGEIKYEYEDKEVTIVHSGENLMSALHPPPSKSFFKQIDATLKMLNIKVVLGDKLKIQSRKPYISGANTYTTENGVYMQADLILYCTGKKLDNAIYPREWKDPVSARLRVVKTLQLVEHPHIFAIGDVNDYEENKQGYFAAKQGELAASNIKKLIKGKTKLNKYNPGFGTGRSFIFVSLGRKVGVSFVGFMSCGPKFTATFKSKDLFVKDWWKVYRVGKATPKERGGPSLGGRLTVVQKPLNLMSTQKTQTFNNEYVGRSSLDSTASISEGYNDSLYDHMSTNSLAQPSQQSNPAVLGVPRKQINRNEVISFVGGRNFQSVEEDEKKASTPAFNPMSAEELNISRTMGRSRTMVQKELSMQEETIESTAHTVKRRKPKKATAPLQNLQAVKKPNRNDIVSFVGSQVGDLDDSSPETATMKRKNRSINVPVLSPLSDAELQESRQKTLARKNKAATPASLQALQYAGKPKRNEIISFVGTGGGNQLQEGN